MLDNFGGAAAWDRYCAKQEEEYQYLLRTTKCRQCGWFRTEDDEGYKVHPYCYLSGEEVEPDDIAIENNCEDLYLR